MKKLNLALLKRIGVLAKPYWFSDEKWKARGLFAGLILLLVADTQFSVYFNRQSGEFTSALAAKDASRFWASVRFFFALLVGAVPVYASYYYVRDLLSNHWRRWLTHQLLGRYFDDHAFFRLLNNTAVDNPDQRIAEDINSFTRQSLNFLILQRGFSTRRVRPRTVDDFDSAGVLFVPLRGGRNGGHVWRLRRKDGRAVLQPAEKGSRFPLRIGAHPRKCRVDRALSRRRTGTEPD
jgi:hypothetical protein